MQKGDSHKLDAEEVTSPGDTITIVEKANLDKQPLWAERVTAYNTW